MTARRLYGRPRTLVNAEHFRRRRLLGDQTVLEYIDTGGCFHVYKVGRHAYDTNPRVAKVVTDPGLLELAGEAFVALQYLSHPSIPRPFDGSMRPEAPYHLLEVRAGLSNVCAADAVRAVLCLSQMFSEETAARGA